ncbi:hypothetical protein EJ110_NYTH06737 [Nymphaea thermarum]|nr:hypothetical protein EJ110_NYTH06737 [Nymphaea thermarum]
MSPSTVKLVLNLIGEAASYVTAVGCFALRTGTDTPYGNIAIAHRPLAVLSTTTVTQPPVVVVVTRQGTLSLKGILLLQRSPGAQEQQRKGREDSLKDAWRGFAAAGFARNAASDCVTGADGDTKLAT